MALINCPECGKQISDQSEVCIHCGFPIENVKSNKILISVNGIEYDFTEILNCIKNERKTPALCIRDISDTCNIPIHEAKEMYFKLKNKSELPKEINCESKNQLNVPHCPTCNSTNIKKISSTRKIAGALGFGLLSKTAKSQFECLNCGYKW